MVRMTMLQEENLVWIKNRKFLTSVTNWLFSPWRKIFSRCQISFRGKKFSTIKVLDFYWRLHHWCLKVRTWRIKFDKILRRVESYWNRLLEMIIWVCAYKRGWSKKQQKRRWLGIQINFKKSMKNTYLRNLSFTKRQWPKINFKLKIIWQPESKERWEIMKKNCKCEGRTWKELNG